MSAEKKWSGLWRLRDPRERFVFQGGSEIATALANTFDRLLEDRDALTAERDALRRYLRHERDKDMSDTIRMEEQCAIYARDHRSPSRLPPILTNLPGTVHGYQRGGIGLVIHDGQQQVHFTLTKPGKQEAGNRNPP